MIGFPDTRMFDLLIARLCHELVGPISAVNNGAELLAEDDAGFVGDAVKLVGDSARRAGQRLQFYRFAYGFSPGGGLSGPPPHELAAGYFEGSRVSCDYGAAARALPLEWQKLACNLLLVGAEALPRGGTLTLGAGPAGPELEAAGGANRPSREAEAALALTPLPAELTPRTVQPYFAAVLGRALRCRLLVEAIAPSRFRIAATPPA